MHYRTPLLAWLALVLAVQLVRGKVVQVQVVHRHGARPPLDKHPFDPTKEDIDHPLFPDGRAQLRALGEYTRKTYVDGDGDLVIPNISKDEPGFGDVLSYSSNLRRTLVSARAFLDGLYSGTLQPTTVFATEENDWIMRGYANCPVLADKFEEFVKSDEFKKKEEEDGNGKFVKAAAAKLKRDINDAFENVFEVYDRHLVLFYDRFGADVRPDGDGTPLSTSEMERLRELADWYESSKFDFASHQIHVAGGLLREILKRASAHIAEPGSGGSGPGSGSGGPGPGGRPIRDDSAPHRIIEYSAHYPTILTLFASLRARNSRALEWPATEIPGFGAALFVELHKEDGELYVRMKYFEGGNETETVRPRPVTVGRAPCTDAENGCKLSELSRVVAQEDVRPEAFCSACGSDVDICRRLGSEQSATSGSSECPARNRVTAGVVGGVVGLGIGLLMALGFMLCRSRRKRRNYVAGVDEGREEVEGDVGA